MSNKQLIVSFCFYAGDCEWGPYGAFTECSTTCGPGIKDRSRVIVQEADAGGRNCTGESSQELACNLRPCGSKYKYATYY